MKNKDAADVALDTIKCPSCGEPIPVNETIYHQISERVRTEAKKETLEKQKLLADREKELKEKEDGLEKTIAAKISSERSKLEEIAKKQAEDAVALELEDLKRQAAEKDDRLAKLQQAELDLLKQKRDLEEKERTLELNMQKALDVQKEKIRTEAAKKAEETFLVELKDLREQAATKDQKLKEAQEAELELRKQKRDLEEREKTLELETARKIDEAKAKIEEEAVRRVQEDHRLKDAEKDKKLQDALHMNEELQRKLQQGSQQTQGEVMELELEEIIRSAFPIDQIDPVPKGVSGADVMQRVFNRSGQLCGTIVWELKRTKNWTDGWMQKLKDDQRLVKAEIAILVTEALPKDVKNFANVSGIWVTSPECAMGLAIALRTQLIEVATAKLASVGKNEKMEALYQYISGAEFGQRVQAIVEAFVDMNKDLQEEKRVAERRWAKREKQIQRVISNTSGMYGDFQGLIGSSLQAIPALVAGETENDSKEGDPPADEIVPVVVSDESADIEEIPF